MKKIFALLALVLGVVSCQTEPEGLDVNVGGEVETTVCVSLPEATRANSAVGAFDNLVRSDEYTIRYIFQVFYEGTESQAKRQVIYTDNDRVSFPVRLVPGRHYNFVVWADVTTTAGKELNTIHNLTIAEAAAADIHYNTENLKAVSIIDDQWVAMDETRDAFTGHYDTAGVDGNGEKYTSASSINLILTRPFAKLRVITTDMEQLNDLNIIPTRATFQYTTEHYASFNAFAGGVNENAKMSKTHTNFAIKAYDDNVNDKSKVLFTDYFFAKDDQDVVNFILTVYDQRCTEQDVQTDYIIKSNNFNTPIPAHRNNLTTISGNTLTESNNITVEVTKDFENALNPGDAPYYFEAVSNGFEAVKAYFEGKKMIFVDDIVVTQADIDQYLATRSAPAIFPEMNLNGFTLTFVNNTDEPLLTLPEGSSLTIEGGEIILEGTGKGAAIENNGTLTIIDTEVNSSNDGAVVENNGDATITDSTLNDGALVNNGEANIEGSELAAGAVENNGKANVNGGDVEEGAITNGEDAIVGSFIYSAEELQAAVENAIENTANEFTLAADIKGDVVVVIQKPNVKITIDGAEHKFNGYFKVHSNSNHYATAAVTFKNINFETSTASVNFIEALENGAERYSTNITAEKCTFTATGAAVNTAVGLQIKASKWAKAINCTATDLHSLVQAQSCDETVDVIGCTINGKNGVAFKQVKAAKVEGTTIVASGYGIRFDGNTDNYGIVVKNNNITAAQPFIVRKMTGKNNTIALEGNNTLSTKAEYQIVITNGADDAAYVAPTGTYTLTGADDFIVFPYTWAVTNGDELVAALDYGKSKTKTVIFKNDIEMSANQSNAYGKTGINILNGQTLDGAGHTFKVKNAGGTWDTAINTTGGTIKNLTVAQGFRGIFVNHNGTHSEKVILNNVVINGPTYTLSCDQGTYQGLEATNCTFNGWTSYAETIGEIKFNNCSFGKGAGYKTCVPYRPTTFTNCEFCANFDMYYGKYATLINCTSNGEALTPANAYSGFADAKFMNAEGKESVLVSNNEQFAAVAANVNVETIYLSSGKHTLELYTNAVPRESLTIIGTEGTQVEFSNQQVRMPLFKNFTIENCEILHMATKSWGMLVFSSGDKADGVYTVKNCTFNGVGTQGIYINEDVSGAKYNVLGCTFNGNFDCNDGAITIQNNTGVNTTVTVADCKFENNFSGNKIFLTKNNNDMTLINPDKVEVACGNR